MGRTDRVTRQPEVMSDKACIRGMRVAVGIIVGRIDVGRSIGKILADYPCREREDIQQTLCGGAWRAEEREVALVRA